MMRPNDCAPSQSSAVHSAQAEVGAERGDVDGCISMDGILCKGFWGDREMPESITVQITVQIRALQGQCLLPKRDRSTDVCTIWDVHRYQCSAV